jgi:hypothetical protein
MLGAVVAEAMLVVPVVLAALEAVVLAALASAPADLAEMLGQQILAVVVVALVPGVA